MTINNQMKTNLGKSVRKVGHSVLEMLDQQISWGERLLEDYEKNGIEESLKEQVRDTMAELKEQRKEIVAKLNQ